ncbi:hypothetical protein AZL_005420 [Azospirillum sp. B510]|uniref:hypothetical protein n=1 Tax=Azospirillum sp. (strain B510) TaxID=137722 RepID=UPI0001C4BE9A|nr:hypothetical protein [Azospirillum sp. B510]BAI71180.1 hypothetical protein AZL_005420 [Azospirillum sp. B510]
MMRKKLGTRATGNGVHLHFANRNATRGGKPATRLHSANEETAQADGRDDHSDQTGPCRHLEHACASLQNAAVELETLLATVRGDEQADLHEAIGSIMETLQLIASAHARLEPPIAAD